MCIHHRYRTNSSRARSMLPDHASHTLFFSSQHNMQLTTPKYRTKIKGSAIHVSQASYTYPILHVFVSQAVETLVRHSKFTETNRTVSIAQLLFPESPFTRGKKHVSDTPNPHLNCTAAIGTQRLQSPPVYLSNGQQIRLDIDPNHWQVATTTTCNL
jgi:hypothetical protein